MSSVYDWSTDAGANASSDSGINWAEGQQPSTVNNSARAMMGRLAEFVKDIGGSLAAGGTANGITVTANADLGAYADGMIIAFKAAANNTGSTTLNVNAVGTRQIRKLTGSGDVPLSANDIRQNGIYVCRYNSSLNSGSGGWQLLNPSAGFANLVSPSTDNAIVRFDGTSGALQDSLASVNDIGRVSAVGIFSTADIQASNADVIASNYQVGGSGVYSVSSAGTIRLRPNGKGSSTGEVSIETNGQLFAPNIASNVFIGTNGGSALFTTENGTGQFLFRPLGPSIGTGQFVIGNSGNVAVNGNLTVSGTANLSSGGVLGSSSSDAVTIKGTAVASFSSGLLDNSSAAAWRSDLGLGSLATQNSVNINTGTTGTLSIANGGTGATNAATALANLGVSSFSSGLLDNTSAAAWRSDLGLGSLATQSSVNIVNDTTGTLSVARGGTGATSSASALANLGGTPTPYSGGTHNNTNFPVGDRVLARVPSGATLPARNEARATYTDSAPSGPGFVTNSGTAQLAGTWRARGAYSIDTGVPTDTGLVEMVRVA